MQERKKLKEKENRHSKNFKRKKEKKSNKKRFWHEKRQSVKWKNCIDYDFKRKRW